MSRISHTANGKSGADWTSGRQRGSEIARQKQQEAEQRVEAWAKLSLLQQLDSLDCRDERASSQRLRIITKMSLSELKQYLAKWSNHSIPQKLQPFVRGIATRVMKEERINGKRKTSN